MLKKNIHSLLLVLISFLPMASYAFPESTLSDDKSSFINTIWVVGDHSTVATAFEACAMFFGSGGIMGALMVSAVLSLLCMAVATVVQRNMQVFNYIVIFVLISAFFGVKTTVYITPYFTPNPHTGKVTGGVIGAVPSHKVDNIPLGIAVPLGLMSNIAKIITEKFDTAFKDPESTKGGYLIQGSEGFFSPLKQILKLRNQWNLPDNQDILYNINAIMRPGAGGCSWGDGLEQMGKAGIRGLFLHSSNAHLGSSTVSGITTIKMSQIDPATGQNIPGTSKMYTMHCDAAAVIVNAQMLQSVIPLDEKGYSKVAANLAKTRSLSLTGSGTDNARDAKLSTQAELNEIPQLLENAIKGYKADSRHVGTAIRNPALFLNQAWAAGAKKEADKELLTSADMKAYTPDALARNGKVISAVGHMVAREQINAAEIQANMIFGNLLFNCLQKSGDNDTCVRYNNTMQDAYSKARIDSAGEASMFQHYMHYGMNILLFIYVVMSPIMVIVIIAMGIQGWRLVKSYLLFSVWINSWLPLSIAIAYYQLNNYNNAMEKLAESLMSDPGMIYSPIVLNNIINGAQDTIASASTFMSSVPLIMLSLLGGSIYGLTQLAQRAGMTGKDFINEGAITQSPTEAGTYNNQLVQAMLASTHSNATSANADRLILGTNQGDHVNLTLSKDLQSVESAKLSISSDISKLESIGNVESWAQADTKNRTIDGGINITTTFDGKNQISFGTDAAHSLSSGQGFSLGVQNGKVVAINADGKVDETVQLVHKNGKDEVFGINSVIQEGDSIKTDFGTVDMNTITSAATQEIAHKKSQLSAIETARSESSGGGFLSKIDNETYNHAVSGTDGYYITLNALRAAAEYDPEFEFVRKIQTAQNTGQELAIVKDALYSNDFAQVKAASAYLSAIFRESRIDNGETLAKQIDAYTAIQTSSFKEQVLQNLDRNIDARYAQSLGDYRDNSTWQKGTSVRNNIESGKIKVGYQAGVEQNAREHGGYTIPQQAMMEKENIAAMKAAGDRLMNAMEDYNQRSVSMKLGDWEFQSARKAWELTKENWDRGDYGAAAFGAGLSAVDFIFAPVVQAASDVLYGSESSQNNLGVHSVGNPELQKLLDEAKDTDKKIREYMNNPQDLKNKPFDDEVAKKVGAPQYQNISQHTENQERLNKQPESHAITNPRMMHPLGEPSTQTGLDPFTRTIATLTGSSIAHAGTMPDEHLQKYAQKGQSHSTISKLSNRPTGTAREYLMEDGSIQVRTDGTVAWRNNNPGNLKFEYANSADKTVKSKRTYEQALKSAQSKYDGVVDLDQWGNAIFATEELGMKAKEKLVTGKLKDKTVAQMVRYYARDDYSSKANHTAYENTIYKTGDSMGVNLRNKKIGDMNSKEKEALLKGMLKQEGYRKGKIKIK